MRSCIGMGSVPCGNANLGTQGLKPARSFHRYLAPPLRVARRSTGGLAENNSSHFCHAPDIPAGRPQSGFGGGGDAASRRQSYMVYTWYRVSQNYPNMHFSTIIATALKPLKMWIPKLYGILIKTQDEMPHTSEVPS